MTAFEVLRVATVRMWLLGSALTDENDQPLAASVQLGPKRQGVLANDDQVGDEPRLLVDFNAGRPLLSLRGQPVGERRGKVIRLWDRDFHVRRRWWWARRRFEISVGNRVVLTVRPRSRPDSTVHTLSVGYPADLDPVTVLALLIVQERPDKMDVLGELTRD